MKNRVSHALSICTLKSLLMFSQTLQAEVILNTTSEIYTGMTDADIPEEDVADLLDTLYTVTRGMCSDLYPGQQAAIAVSPLATIRAHRPHFDDIGRRVQYVGCHDNCFENPPIMVNQPLWFNSKYI